MSWPIGAAIALINDLGHDKALAFIQSEFRKADLPLHNQTIETIPNLETSESMCPSVTLLNERTASANGPFRPTTQTFGNCYVHAAVRALDYERYTRGHFSTPISIAATSVEANADRVGGSISNIDYGHEYNVIAHLRSFGACPLNELDENGETHLWWLDDLYKDLKGSETEIAKLPRLTSQQIQTPLHQQSRESLERALQVTLAMAAISAKWKASTIKVINQALVNEQNEAAAPSKEIVPPRPPL
ncbi:MAG: hypothetical protein HC902_08350 [Calothrix sp. SM1_5_4]|nr:hypothetical protein [Calothrix sp. SM1_5_4]